MFGKMLLTQQMIRAIYKERNYLPNEKIIEMMTIDAAKCLGAEKEIGSIEIGKKADILTINIDSLNFAPAYDIPNLIVRNVKSENIINVMINGKILIRNRQFIYVDEKEVIKDANEKSHQIIERANLQKFAYPQKYFWNDIKAYYDGPRYDE